MKYKKSFKEFIEEAVRIVSFKKNFTYNEPQKKKYDFKTKSSKSNVQDTVDIDNAIDNLNKISSKYGASVDFTEHLKKRIMEREYNAWDVVDLFKGISKNSKYFDDLKKNNNLLIDGKGPQMINTTKKVHVGTFIKNNGSEIIIKSIMGDFSRKYMKDLKNKRIPLYFTR